MVDKHLSTQFDAELSGISTRVLEMGGLVESQVALAIEALTHFNGEVASQVLIGASYRRNGNSQQQARLSVTAPANLVSTAGDTIPVSEISWTVSAPGSPVPGIIPAGTFVPGQQPLANVPPNTFIENCHSFRYANSAIRAAGTYDGTVTYTLSAP